MKPELELLTPAEAAVARAEGGWGLYWLYDGQRGWMVRPLPIANFVKPVETAAKLLAHIQQVAVNQVTFNGVTNPIHQVSRRALQLSANPPPMKTRK